MIPGRIIHALANTSVRRPPYPVKDWRRVLPDVGDGFYKRDLKAISRIVIHHTVTPPLDPQDFAWDWESIIGAIYQYHTETQGWHGIGYHYIATPQPAWYYVGDIRTTRACVWGLNTTSLCIALLGDYTSWQPLGDVLLMVADRIKLLRKWLPWIRKVSGHRDYALPGHATACPGATWDQWRRKVGV